MGGVRLHGWRKIAGATWGPPADPQVYGDLDIDAGSLQEYLRSVRERTGVRVTTTHLATRAVALALRRVPEANGMLRLGRFSPHGTVDVFVIVALEDGRDLSGVKIREADRKSAVDIATELAERAERLRTGRDPDLGRTKGLLDALPPPLLRAGLRAADFVTGTLGLDLPRAGLPHQPFGGAMVSSVGMLGLQHAYSALSPYYRVPMVLLVGEIAPRPVVVAGRVDARPVLGLTATLDHRYVDAYQASRIAQVMREYLEHPAAFEPPLTRTVVLPEPREGAADVTTADDTRARGAR